MFLLNMQKAVSDMEQYSMERCAAGVVMVVVVRLGVRRVLCRIPSGKPICDLHCRDLPGEPMRSSVWLS